MIHILRWPTGAIQIFSSNYRRHRKGQIEAAGKVYSETQSDNCLKKLGIFCDCVFFAPTKG